MELYFNIYRVHGLVRDGSVFLCYKSLVLWCTTLLILTEFLWIIPVPWLISRHFTILFSLNIKPWIMPIIIPEEFFREIYCMFRCRLNLKYRNQVLYISYAVQFECTLAKIPTWQNTNSDLTIKSMQNQKSSWKFKLLCLIEIYGTFITSGDICI